MQIDITNDYLPMLHSIAWKFHHTTGIDIDDLFGEACVAAVEQMSKYDTSRGCITTFLNTAIQNRLSSYILLLKRKKRKKLHRSMFLLADDRLPDRSMIFTSNIKRLGTDAKRLCQMILESPEKYLHMNCQELASHLRNDGWAWRDIRIAYKEIKQLLKSVG